MKTGHLRVISTLGSLLIAGAATSPAPAADPEDARASAEPESAPRDVLTPEQWQQVEVAIDRALAWMATQQQQDGSFPTLRVGQPGVTSLCVLSLLACGHLPGEGRYGQQIDAAIDFVLDCQKSDGLIAYVQPPARMNPHNAAHTAIYNHAIAGLMLVEVYGMTDETRARRIRPVIERAIQLTRDRQQVPRQREQDKGGWRYLRPWGPSESDLSITAWQVMFLRAARNAGFDVPTAYIDEAMQYIQRGFDRRRGTFLYGLIGKDRHPTRAMAGAGILSLSLGGLHHTPPALAAGDWLLKHPFDEYKGSAGLANDSRYHYGAYYCTQAMFQLGGRYWEHFYPRLVRVLLANQTPLGHWDDEPGEDWHYGHVYSTALAVLALSTPYQLLPIYQR